MDFEDLLYRTVGDLQYELSGRKKESLALINEVNSMVNDAVEAFEDSGYRVPESLLELQKNPLSFKKYDKEKPNTLSEMGIEEFAHDLIQARNVLNSSRGDISKYEEGLDSIISHFADDDNNPFLELDEEEQYQLASDYQQAMGEMYKRYSNVKMYDSATVLQMVNESKRLGVDFDVFLKNYRYFEGFMEEISELDEFDTDKKIVASDIIKKAKLPSMKHAKERMRDLRKHRKEFKSFTRFNELVKTNRKKSKSR